MVERLSHRHVSGLLPIHSATDTEPRLKVVKLIPIIIKLSLIPIAMRAVYNTVLNWSIAGFTLRAFTDATFLLVSTSPALQAGFN